MLRTRFADIAIDEAQDCSPETAEAPRVLHVAVPRTRRLVSLALSDSGLETVRDFLADREIAHRALHAQAGVQTVLPL
ncbi:hypothetical protein [Streptantibioticus cattleyicolor]|uniref:Uncharacterized protein n=1 Tax=Streptantibioticus cattleyicolor (strain ATCC 35852 / DSM 46488 / JCM 4925 / NBRC 14057 / NRRL 8057) TaxID=1003195 RepID=F8JMU0_STREN|nr:hypothetical protein [Streptantibioticus cattleyicolor]AEW99272.1 hypothetical protein SCATT_p10790 [Streptantibioticus cattleyicolor NRRL 8057 = DSM 46488]CCB71686.1 protein of unknown function [Streptantibioticus cattleyicolor NRRL 8057 = DSM 46488]